MDNFAQRFSKFQNQRLFQIIDSPQDYDPEAVEAAKNELANRKIAQSEIDNYKAKSQEKRDSKLEKANRQKANRDYFIGSISEFSAALSPVQIGDKTARQKIVWFSILFGAVALHSAYTSAVSIYFDFQYGELVSSDIEYNIILIMGFIPLISVILFWLIYRVGWILLTGYLIFSAASSLLAFLYSFEWSNQLDAGYTYGNLDYTIERIFPTTSPWVYLLHLVFYLGAFWLVFGADVRNTFKIEKKTAYTVVSASAIVSLLLSHFLLS
ncbi:MAG: hypothetical protein AAF741_14685 [Bacteroidota bacterium]